MTRRTLMTAIILGTLTAGATAEERTHTLDHRMAAWHRTIVSVNERTGNAGVSSYVARPGYGGLNVLGKFVTGVMVDGAVVPSSEAKDLRMEDFPGGVTTTFTLGGVKVTVEIMPLLEGAGAEPWEGAALLRWQTEPAAAIVIMAEGESEQTFAQPPSLGRNEVGAVRDLAVSGNSVTHTAGVEDKAVALRASVPFAAVPAGDGQALRLDLPDGSGWVVLGHAHDPARAAELAAIDPATGSARVTAHYDALLASRIDTPIEVMNQAFRTALYNLEYNYIGPYGWNECIHHWLSFWHNQHTAGAEWIGQEDRSRLVTAYHGQNLLPSGAAPQFMTDGTPKRDFGGSNQYWTWQAWHYWKFTGDLEFVREMAPALDRILYQTLDEHDKDGNLLIGWGLQIGNQEDFIQYPMDGSTPSIELINMMRTRVAFAEALGDAEAAALWSGRVRRATDELRRVLWLEDLGRLAFFSDAHGKKRIDAQYHSFLYPVIWDLADELDGYASLRQVHDRLTGPDGAVYCSNNFPNHAVGTWGMQGGAAQQPWAAWAYSKAGQREATWRPLNAVASWVMNPDHRGAWPEVSIEATPAYFTPPAGLYVASVVEALFGLFVDKPAGSLDVTPSFPDDWPSASVSLPKYSADYQRDGNRLAYTVRSADALARRVRWSLPPSTVASVTVDGESVSFETTPGVNRTVVSFETAPATETLIQIDYRPAEVTLDAPGSVAEGEPVEVAVKGAKILSVDDRLGVLAGCTIDGGILRATVRRGLLEAYLPFGRLGLATFGRRTFFLECEAPGGVRFWQPVDLAILPRVEAAPAGEVTARGDALSVTMLLRNNTNSPMRGTAWLHAAQNDLPFGLDLAPRSELVAEVTVPGNLATLFTAGDNRAVVTFPGNERTELTLSVTQPFETIPVLRDHGATRLVQVPIPEEDTVPYTEWAKTREGSHAGPVPWPGWVQPLEGMEEQTRIEVPEIPGLAFDFAPGRWVVVGEKIGNAHYQLALPPGMYRKFYVLLATLADNDDIFSRIGHATVRSAGHVLHSRPLYLPGDLDWWEHNGMGATMGTARTGKPDRLGLLPLLAPGQADWAETRPIELESAKNLHGPLGGRSGSDPLNPWTPPVFPAPEHWASSRVVRTPNCTFNVLEIDLGKPQPAAFFSLTAEGVCPGFAILGIVAEQPAGMETLGGTPWMPPARFRAPDPLFTFNGPESLDGWTLEGEAFSLTDAYETLSLNSLSAKGETATGRAVSPAFTVPKDAVSLSLTAQGGNNRDIDGQPTLCFRLLDADTGEALAQANPPGTHIPQEVLLQLEGIEGRNVRLELLDANPDPSYAWIALSGAGIRYH